MSHRILSLDVGYGCLRTDSVFGCYENAPVCRALRSVAPANHLSDRTCAVLAVQGQDIDDSVRRELKVEPVREAKIEDEHAVS